MPIAMPVWFRRLLMAAAVLLGLLIAAAVYVVASFDANRYKGVLIDWVRDHQQRTLAIDGPIGLSVFPRLAVTLRDVRLSEQHRTDEFLALKEATLAVQVLPLLSQQLAVDRVSASGLRLVYTRDAQGRRNIDDLLTPTAEPPAPPAASAPQAGSAALRFDISSVELIDLQVSVRDAMAGLDGHFAVERLATGRLAAGAQSPVELKARAQLTRPAADAQLELVGKLQLDLTPGGSFRMGLSDLRLALRGEGFQLRQLDAQLTGALDYDSASGALGADRLALRFSGERLGVVFKDSRLTLAQLGFDPAKRALRLDTLELQLAGRRGDQTLAASLTWPSLAVDGDRLQGSALKGNASLASAAQSLQLGFSSQAPSGRFELIRMPGLQADVSGSAGARTLKGEARADLALATQPVAAALDALTLRLAFADPGLPPLALNLQGSAKTSVAAASWSLSGAVNEQSLTVSGKADLSRPVPQVDMQARFAALDLTRFVKPAPAGSAGTAGTAGPAGTTDAADPVVDLSGLKAIDGRFSVRAGSLTWPPYQVADLTMDATLAGGTLRVSQLAGRAWGGRFEVQATAQAAASPKDQRATIKLDASDVNVAALLKDVARFERLEGRGRVSADLATRGASVEQFKQQLGGTAAFDLRDGAVRGINLAKTLRQWRAAVSQKKDAAQASSAEEKTDFSEISASFQVQDGVARNRDLVAKSPFLRLGGEGSIDIGRGRIDYLAKATVTGAPEGQDGADLAALKGVTVPVELKGPLTAVDYRIQWAAVAADLLRGQAKEALDAKAGKLLDKLEGRSPASSASASQSAASSPKDSNKDRLKKLLGL